MAAFETVQDEFKALDVKMVASSVDPLDKAQEVADEVSFPVGYGVTRDIADQLGSFWEERRQIIQPSEFIVGRDNKIIGSSYSDGPLGRIDAADVVKLVNFYNSRE